ncbi:MAG TPA: hypothetical protein VGI30_14080, partial [Caulobacteraceae bacterium]
LMPYRDYFLASTPLYIPTCGGALRLFGDTVAVAHAFGVFERLVIAGLVYAWLSRLFAVRHALLATVVTMVASAADNSDPIASYNHETIMWAIASGLAASFALDFESTPGRAGMAAFLSGFFASLSFATKQTMGLGATLFIPAAVCLCILRLAGVRKAREFLLLFVAGWAIPAGALLFWMGHIGVIHQFLVDTFFKGPAAKAGSPLDFLTRAILVAKLYWWALLLGVVTLALSWNNLRRAGASNKDVTSDSWRSVLLVGLCCAAAIGIGVWASYSDLQIVNWLSKPAIYFTLFTTLALLLTYAWLWLRGTLSPREAQLCLLATVSFVMAFMVSLSYPLFEAMLLPGLGFLIAAVLDSFRGWRPILTDALCALLLATLTCAKLELPFGFDGFNEPPVRTATAVSDLPEMEGLRLPPAIVNFIDGAARIVAARSSPGDTIFTYPEMGIFYPITHRNCPTGSCSTNIDVVNDSSAREEAAGLLKARPAVLIYNRPSETILHGDELVWRHGRPSGQRAMIAAMETLSSEYDLVATFKLPPDGLLVSVYARPMRRALNSGVTR